MADIGRKLGDEGQMSSLTWRAVITGRDDGVGKWFVIGINNELSAFQEMFEVFYREVNGQQLTVKCLVLPLGGGQGM